MRIFRTDVTGSTTCTYVLSRLPPDSWPDRRSSLLLRLVLLLGQPWVGKLVTRSEWIWPSLSELLDLGDRFAFRHRLLEERGPWPSILEKLQLRS